jgi:hypothetical protein
VTSGLGRQDELSVLNGLLERLLYDTEFRRGLAGGSRDGLSPLERGFLAQLDVDEANAFATMVRRDVLRRCHRGCGSLLTAFPQTIAAWLESHPEDLQFDQLASEFVGSSEFGEFRSLPHAGVGICLEEAFHRFCSRRGVGSSEVLEHEFLLSIMRALSTSANPSFALPRAVRPAPAGYFAVGGSRSVPVLYAALNGALVTGPITPTIRELLLEEQPPSLAAGARPIGGVLGELWRLGLLARPSSSEACSA